MERKENPYQPYEADYWAWMKNNPPTEMFISRGAPKKLKPKELWCLACDYFEMMRENNFLKQDFIKGGADAGKIIELKQCKPYSWAGLQVYMYGKGAIRRLDEYRRNTDGAYNDYIEVVHAIDTIILSNKFEGAAANVFNSSIMIRDLGLADKQNITTKAEQPLFGPDDEADTDNK